MTNQIQKIRQSEPIKQVRRLYWTFREFVQLEVSGGIFLMAATIIALIWANSPWRETYTALWHIPISVGIGDSVLSHDLHWWINEALMVIFFFVVGLEIKREILVGELSSLRQAALPVAAALGGMLLPALFYTVINWGTDGLRGWGVPMATDIAFALGVMALLGSKVPLSLKIFLTALAIVDDIGAVLVIAIFYTGEIAWVYLAVAAGILVFLVFANLFGARSLILYSVLGIALWLAFLYSGVHATLAGVLLALTIPARAKLDAREYLEKAHNLLHEFEHAGENNKSLRTAEQQAALFSLEDSTEKVETPLQRLEHALHPWVTFAIIPLFALANAGVEIRSDFTGVLTSKISLGIMAGLVLGKQFGVTFASWLAVKLGLAELPSGVTWKHIYGASLLAGIGFTMSLFISALAFTESAIIEATKVGILVGSLIAGIAGILFLRNTRASRPEDEEE